MPPVVHRRLTGRRGRSDRRRRDASDETHTASRAGADAIGAGALVGLTAGCLVGIAVGLTLAPPDIAWPVISVAVGLLAGLCTGVAVGVAVDVRRRACRPPPRQDDPRSPSA